MVFNSHKGLRAVAGLHKSALQLQVQIGVFSPGATDHAGLHIALTGGNVKGTGAAADPLNRAAFTHFGPRRTGQLHQCGIQGIAAQTQTTRLQGKNQFPALGRGKTGPLNAGQVPGLQRYPQAP